MRHLVRSTCEVLLTETWVKPRSVGLIRGHGDGAAQVGCGHLKRHEHRHERYSCVVLRSADGEGALRSRTTKRPCLQRWMTRRLSEPAPGARPASPGRGCGATAADPACRPPAGWDHPCASVMGPGRGCQCRRGDDGSPVV